MCVCVHVWASAWICIHTCLRACEFVRVTTRFSPGRRGSRRRCCTCLCSLRGPCLRPAARTPRLPRPDAGSHCWRRSRNSDQRPERWRWLSPVTHGGHVDRQLEHGANWANTSQMSPSLPRPLSQNPELPHLPLFFHYILLLSGFPLLQAWVLINYLQASNETITSMTSQMDGSATCDPQMWTGNTGHSASYRSAGAGLGVKEQRMGIWLGCGDKRTQWGQQVVYGETSSAKKEQLLTCCLQCWPSSICMISSCYAGARQFYICMLCVSSVLLTQRQWIFTCLLTHLIGFTHCGHLNTHSHI